MDVRIIGFCVLVFVLLCAQASLAHDEEDPRFYVSVSPCPTQVSVPVGGVRELQFDVSLTTTDQPDDPDVTPVGTSGWSYSLALAGAIVLDVTTQGTVAARIDDDPSGLREVTGVDRTLSLGSCDSNSADQGVVGATLLSFDGEVTLPAFGSSIVAKVTVLVDASPRRQSKTVRFYGGGRCSSVEGGGRYDNLARWNGENIVLTVRSCEFQVVIEPMFRRGDANDSAEVNLRDALDLLGCQFGRAPCSACPDAMDANDDGRIDLADGIYVIEYLFSGAKSPSGPVLGVCRTDANSDTLAACGHVSCES